MQSAGLVLVLFNSVSPTKHLIMKIYQKANKIIIRTCVKTTPKENFSFHLQFPLRLDFVQERINQSFKSGWSLFRTVKIRIFNQDGPLLAVQTLPQCP